MYTGSSIVSGDGSSTANDIYEWFKAHAPSGASYVGLPILPIYPGVGHDIITFCQRWDINWDHAAALIAHESAYLQSRIYRDKRNPSGLGAVNDNAYDGAVTFATEREGIRATIAHMAVYVHGDGEWAQYDPRYQAVKNAGWLGVVRVLNDFNGRWAWPGTTYGQSLATKATSLARFAESRKPRPQYPDPIIRQREIRGVPFRVSLIPDTNRNRPGDKILRYGGPTIHETGNFNRGANAEMHRRFTHNGGGGEGVSFTFVVDEDEIIQLLPLDEVSIHGGSRECNEETWGIELCVNSDGDFGKTMANAAELVLFLWDYWPGVRGKKRQHFDCSGKNCPMLLRNGRWSEFVAMLEDDDPVPAPDPNVLKLTYPGDGKDYYIVNDVTVDGHEVRMLDFYREMGGLPRLGYPKEGMRRRDDKEPPVYIQRCENVLLECWVEGFGNMPGPYYRFGLIP